MLTALLTTVLTLLVPNAPAWLPTIIGAALPAAFEIVDELRDSGLKGPQKLQLAVVEIGLELDEAFDTIPEWSELKESQRDAIITGLVELALFIAKLTDKQGKRGARKGVRKAMSKLKKD